VGFASVSILPVGIDFAVEPSNNNSPKKGEFVQKNVAPNA